jgi:hypothetical protein
MAHPSDEDALQRLLPMNSLGWIICHLAGQERRFWLIPGLDGCPVRRSGFYP